MTYRPVCHGCCNLFVRRPHVDRCRVSSDLSTTHSVDRCSPPAIIIESEIRHFVLVWFNRDVHTRPQHYSTSICSHFTCNNNHGNSSTININLSSVFSTPFHLLLPVHTRTVSSEYHHSSMVARICSPVFSALNHLFSLCFCYVTALLCAPTPDANG